MQGITSIVYLVFFQQAMKNVHKQYQEIFSKIIAITKKLNSLLKSFPKFKYTRSIHVTSISMYL